MHYIHIIDGKFIYSRKKWIVHIAKLGIHPT